MYSFIKNNIYLIIAFITITWSIINNVPSDQKTNTNKEESYLSQAIDMIDLERRQKELDRRFIRKF